ncbi:MAG: rhombosortase [Gammaproteobacteria bacterium]|jgi:rhomboid family GlyGly-CTERM serine protease|nr:rhombosortase [Gammaproteobacteria bacterium]
MSIARSLNCDGRHGAGLALAVLLLLLPVLGGQGLNLAWRYERAAVAAGQWWRFVTCHLVHLDAAHALLNAVGLALLWALFARAYSWWQWGLALGASIAATGIGFWFFSTQLVWYVGASGVLHGVFACGCIAMLRQRDRIGLIAAVIFAGKLLYEQWQGPLPFESADMVVTVAHLYGAIGGAAMGLLLRGRGQQLY